MYVVAWASAYWASGRPTHSSACGGGDGDLERARVGVADVLGGADDQPPGDELRILAGRDHRGEPVQRRVGVVAAQALDERRHGVVVAVAGAVVGEDPLLGGGLDVRERRRDVAGLVAFALVLGEGDRALRGR